MVFQFVGLFCIFVASSSSMELPSDIPKCRLIFPEVSECITEKGNLVLKDLVTKGYFTKMLIRLNLRLLCNFKIQGHAAIGIPVLSPMLIPELKFEGVDFNLLLTDVYFESYKDYKLTHTSLSLNGNDTELVFEAPYLNVSASYVMSNTTILFQKIIGSGQCNITLGNISERWISSVRTYEKDGKNHIKATESKAILTAGHATYYFEGLHFIDTGFATDNLDANDFLNRNWQVVLQLIKPKLEDLFLGHVQDVVSAIHIRVPLAKIFDE